LIIISLLKYFDYNVILNNFINFFYFNIVIINLQFYF